MNEELKIIIRAVTDEAKKNISAVKKELQGVETQGKDVGKTLDAAMKGVAKGAAVAIGSIAALTAAMVKLGQSAKDIDKGFSRLKSSFVNAGSSAKEATKYYKELFGILGDHDRTVETGQSLARITTDPAALSDYKNIMAGVVSQYGDGYQTEMLAENISETIAAAKVTGDLERVLVEAGISADGFNAALASLTSMEERELLIRNTLNGVLGNAGKAYIQANQGAILLNQSQANLNITLAQAAGYTTPLLTAINNLGASLLTFLAPALETVSIYLTGFIQLMVEAIQWVGGFFGLFSSSTETATADVEGYQKAMNNYLSGLGGTFGTTNGELDKSLKKINAVKRATMGFDELNVVSNPASAAADAVGGGAGAGGGSGLGSLGAIPNPADYGIGVTDTFKNLTKDIEKAKEKIKGFLTLVGIAGATFALWKLEGFISEIIAANKLIKIGAKEGAYQYQKVFAKKAQEGLDAMKAKMASIGGTMLIVAGAIALVKGYTDAWVNGVDWGNLALMIGGIAAIAGGLALIFSPVAAGVAAIAGGVALLIIGIKDFVTNGYSMQSVLTILAGVLATVVGVFLAFNIAIWSNPVFWIITGIAALVAAFVVLWNECEGFRNFWINLWEKVKVLFAAFVESIKPLIDAIVGAFKEAWELIKVIWNDYLVPLFALAWEAIKAIWDAVKPYFKTIWESIKIIFSVVKSVLSSYFKYAWEAIKIIWNQVISYFTTIWETIKGIFSVVKDVLTGNWRGAWEGIKGIVDTWKDYFSNTWNNIKKIFSAVKTYFTEVFGAAWEGIKQIFSNWGSFFSGLWDTIKNTFSKLGTSIGDAISDAVKSGINGIITLIENRINKAIGIINGAIDLINKLPGVSVGKIGTLTLPRLATGGIVTSSIIANIGEAGREAVLPLDRNTGWMDALADKIIERQGASGTPIILQVDGKTFAQTTVRTVNDLTRQTGSLQLNIV